ncbi:MAG: OmpA family protein [Crocinitomicaceae bacterium]
MNKIFHILLVTVLLISCGLGKNAVISSENIADCDGALPILQSGASSTELPGSAGKKNEFKEYAALKDLVVGNSVWYSFIAEYDGKFNLKAETASGDLNLVVFQTDGNDICGDIQSGRAEIKRLLVDETLNEVSLTDRNLKNALYPLPMRKGDVIYFVIFARKNKKTNISMTVDLVPNNVEQVFRPSDNKKRVVDLTEEFTPYKTTIQLRDAESGDPVIANIHITGLKGSEITQKASDLIFQPTRSGLASIKCNEEGYFFITRLEDIASISNDTIEIKMQRLKKGKSVQLEDIQFKPGTSEFMPSAEPALLRLREFMGLNSTINIEIQGHVYEPSETTAAGQKMSQARAEQVMKYLVNSGINKKRMTAVGYGASKPVFPNAKRKEEEQMNRRVEILIK